MTGFASQALPEYEVYAIRYATMSRRRAENFLGGDPHDGPMPMDFFVWLIRNQDRCVLVDTGFSADMAAQRRRDFIACPVQRLERLGVAPAQIRDVILTHLHYDHAGNLAKVPSARLHVQDDELDYATGRCMCHASLRHAYEVEDVVSMVRRVYEELVVFHDGDATLYPGIELLKIGGHTKGLQAVRVHTRRGWIVLASDASHFYENMDAGRPFPIVFNVADMLTGHQRLREVVSGPDYVVPGHDPQVLLRYPAYRGESDIVMLHEMPGRSV